MAVSLAPAARPRALRLPRAGSVGRGACAVAGLALALGAAAWLALAAAERPSPLSPPSIRANVPWLLGPLHGLLPRLSTSVDRLHVDQSTALVVLLVGWLLAWASARALPWGVVVGVVVSAQVVTLLGPPQALTDVFNYLQYGRMAAHGVNPYTVLPATGAQPGTLFLLSNWHHLPSPYGPLFTVLCEPLGLMSPEAGLWAWKAILLACTLGVLALTAWLAPRAGVDRRRAIIAVGLCPVTLAEGLGGLHNDLPVIVCLLGSAAALVRGREDGASWRWEVTAALLACVAAGLKPSFAVVLPIVVLGAPRRLPALGAALAGGAVVGLVMLLVFGGHGPAVGLQGRLVTPLSIPNLLGLAAGHGGADASVRQVGRIGLLVVVAGACAVVARRRELALPAIGVVLLATVFSLGWVMPWYLGWCLPFAALAKPRALVPVAVIACVWLGVGASPQMPKLIHALHYFPTRNPTGNANHRFEEGLVK